MVKAGPPRRADDKARHRRLSAEVVARPDLGVTRPGAAHPPQRGSRRRQRTERGENPAASGGRKRETDQTPRDNQWRKTARPRRTRSKSYISLRTTSDSLLRDPRQTNTNFPVITGNPSGRTDSSRPGNGPQPYHRGGGLSRGPVPVWGLGARSRSEPEGL